MPFRATRGAQQMSRRGLEIALAGNFLAAAVRGYSNLAHVTQGVDGDLHEGLRLALEAEKAAQRFGTKATLRWTRGALIGLWFELGHWDQCARCGGRVPDRIRRARPALLRRLRPVRPLPDAAGSR